MNDTSADYTVLQQISIQLSMKDSWVAVPSANDIKTLSRQDWQSITITSPGKSGVFFAHTATIVWSDGTETRLSFAVLPITSIEAQAGSSLNESTKGSDESKRFLNDG